MAVERETGWFGLLGKGRPESQGTMWSGGWLRGLSYLEEIENIPSWSLLRLKLPVTGPMFSFSSFLTKQTLSVKILRFQGVKLDRVLSSNTTGLHFLGYLYRHEYRQWVARI